MNTENGHAVRLNSKKRRIKMMLILIKSRKLKEKLRLISISKSMAKFVPLYCIYFVLNLYCIISNAVIDL
jgi:hypothetical protein